ncbi:MAG: hypothetical protein HY834_04360 [Devosia nanyangense]|uniref:Uncharacterized protein n=1 Tax=Devosia nanyangense TaxID=1228055 RepID=A0A933L0J9_9HYPH|nr:hypothetical protein [Devosia nanyangense]
MNIFGVDISAAALAGFLSAFVGLLAVVLAWRQQSERSQYALTEAIAKIVKTGRSGEDESPKSDEVRDLLNATDGTDLAEVAAEVVKSLSRKKITEIAAADAAARYEVNALRRLSEHSSLLGKRANSSLFAGLGFGAVGAVFLGVLLFVEKPTGLVELTGILSHYLPRLSITLIVELVAFFFLRVYSRTLADIRYIQNEITNIEMKLVGLHIAIERNAADVVNEAVLALIHTERNHILEKGQTSLENERERIESKTLSQLVAGLAEALRGNTK